MSRRTLRLGGWAALTAGILAALAAAAILVVGVLAMAGETTYPVDKQIGPFSLHHEISMPVAMTAQVCQSASVGEPDAQPDCLMFFAHDESWAEDEPVRTQDADIRPTSAQLTGTVDLATTRGWSTFVAASVARAVIAGAVTSAALLLLWRLLAGAAVGTMPHSRAVTYVRAGGWLLLAGGLVGAALGLVTSTSELGYSFESFGSGPRLTPIGDNDWGQAALGGLLVVLATVFRHSAAEQAEPEPVAIAD